KLCYRLGLLGVPTRAPTAAAPLLFGMLIDKFGAGVLVSSSALSIAAFIGLCSLPSGRHPIVDRGRRSHHPRRGRDGTYQAGSFVRRPPAQVFLIRCGCPNVCASRAAQLAISLGMIMN